MLQKHKIDYENVYNLTEQEVLEKYINCDIVSFVSLHEGFGMPIIEGQSIGRPILTSNITPMKEIASNGGAILVNPWDVKSIRMVIKKHLHILMIDKKRIRKCQTI